MCWFSHIVIQWTKPRHRFNLRQAHKVIDKINNFEHDGQKIMYLKKIDPYVFEELLLVALKNKGYIIKRNPSYSGDGGVDGKFYHLQYGWCYIQAKRYKDFIKSDDVMQFVQFCAERKTIGLFIHTGKTSSGSKQIANDNKNIKILSGEQLVKLIKSSCK